MGIPSWITSPLLKLRPFNVISSDKKGILDAYVPQNSRFGSYSSRDTTARWCLFIIGRDCAAMRSRNSLEMLSSAPGRGFMKTIFSFGRLLLALRRSHPKGMIVGRFKGTAGIIKSLEVLCMELVLGDVVDNNL